MSFKISYTFLAKNQFTEVAKKISASVSQMSTVIKTLKSDIKETDSAMIKFGKNTMKVGGAVKTLAGSFAKVSLIAGAVTVASIHSFNEQEQQLAKVSQALITTGGKVGISLKDLSGIASDIQSKTLFGDEQVLSATQTLLMFTNITGEQFKKTQQAAVDLSAKFGTDLPSSAKILGKALNDPAQGLAMLSRSGVQFSEKQKNIIIALAKTNQLGKAQDLILGELNKKFGGTAAAMAAVGTGPLTQLKNQMDDLGEEIGKVQFEALLPFINVLKSLTSWLQDLSPTTKKFIGILILLIVAIAPVLLIISQVITALGALTIVAGAFGVTVGAIALPVLAIIGVLALLVAAVIMVASNWDDMVGGAIMLWNDFVSLIVKGAIFIANAIKDFILAPMKLVGKMWALIGVDQVSKAVDAIDQKLTIGGDINTKSKSQTDVNINLRGQPGAVQSSGVKTTGDRTANIGFNTIEAF